MTKILALSSVAVMLFFSAPAQGEEGSPRKWLKNNLSAGNPPTQSPKTASPVSVVKKSSGAADKEVPEMSKEEMIRQINDVLYADDDILGKIPGLKKNRDNNAMEFYVYSDGEREIRLEDLDTDRLAKLLNDVQIQYGIYQANMAVQQVRIAAEAQKLSAIQRQIPNTPPPQPQRPPSPPPQPPRR